MIMLRTFQRALYGPSEAVAERAPAISSNLSLKCPVVVQCLMETQILQLEIADGPTPKDAPV